MKHFRKLSLLLALVLALSTFFSSAVMAESVYQVKPGDVLWKIAQQFGLTWEELSEYNHLTNPHLLYPGQVLRIPDKNEQQAPDKEDQPATTSEDVKITLLGTSDLHGRIYSYEYAIDSVDADAGLAKIQTLVKQERAKNKNVILMDIGDTVQDNSAELFNNQAVHPMIEALNYMNYDTWTLGNHEFNFEKSFLEKNIKAFNNTVLAANIYKNDGTRFVEPYKIFNKDGVRVAVVGLVPPHIPVWEAAAPEHFEGLTFKGTVEEAKTVVKELEGKYDVLVGAFHLGEDGEHGYEGAAAVAEACPEFDVIFMGHAHSKVNGKEVNGVKLIEPGPYGWALAKADVTVSKKDGKLVVANVTTENLETLKVEEDKEMLAKFEYVHNKSIEDANTVVGQVTDDYVKNVDYITGEAQVTTMPTAQIEDTALIDLINEVQLHYTGAQISSAAAFKNDMNLVKGDFKKKDVANIYMYPNTLMGVNITGANLKKYMEWSASYYNTYKPGDVTISFNPNIRGYNYDMFAGVTYDIDISQEAGSRIKDLKLNGEEIKDDQVYKLAVNNYRFGTLLSLGLVTDADKYYDSYSLMQDAGRIRDLIINYIQKEKGGKAVPTVDHNWKIIGEDLEHPLKAVIFDMIKKGELTIPKSEDGRTPNVKAINVYELIEEGKLEGYETLTILHTNDMHGFFVEGKYDGMGAAKLAAKINEFRADYKNVLLLDAGDATQGNNLVTLSKGENAIKVMNTMKYDAMTAGNHEFDYGKERLLELTDMADFPVLAANVKKADGSDFLTKYVIKEMNGLKVGIFGLATPETVFKSHPKNSEGLTFLDPVDTAKEMVKELEGKVDVIVALAHLGMEGNDTSVKLAENVTGIDVIIDGHSHTELPQGMVINGTLIAQAHEKTKNLGVIQFAIKDGDVVSKSADLFTKAQAANLQEDPAVKAVIDEIKAANQQIEAEVVAVSPVVLNGETANVRTGETNLGNLITAAMMDISGADVALMNGGGIRTTIDTGEVTKGEVLTVLPFGNTVTVIKVTGADLKAAMENGIDSYPNEKGAFPHIGGMIVTFDPSKEAGNRVVEIKVGGQLLDEAKTYTLVTNDFLAAGGDGYSMFKGKDVVAEYSALDEVLIQYIQTNGFDEAKTDGRIQAINAATSMIDLLFAA